MHKVQQAISERLGALPPDFRAIREHAQLYARFCSSVDVDGTLRLGHTPWVAPEAYVVRLYPPAKKTWIRGFKDRTGQAIPPAYAELLLVLNGGKFGGLSLYGLPPSLQGQTPMVDRSRPQPLDLSTACTHWAREYETGSGQFHFGSRDVSRDEVVGYFWSDTGLRAVRRSGEVFGAWRDLQALLDDELAASAARVEEHTPAEWWH